MHCFITQTGSFLPGPPISNDEIERYLGRLDGEEEVKRTVLKMNGITSRHYAQDENQQPTHDVYELACLAISNCLKNTYFEDSNEVTFLSAGTTYAPLGGPGMGSILHDQLAKHQLIGNSVEVSSHAGICTSAAAALVSAARAVSAGEHSSAVCVGSEHPSSALKLAAFDPIDDRAEHTELRRSQWFMSVFLRFMLSDGAGAFLLQNKPNDNGVSLRVDWTESRSFAHEKPLCMKVENQGVRITQDIDILSRHLIPATRKFCTEVMTRRGEDLADYKIVLPHLSSFFFRRRMEKIMKNLSSSDTPVPYWTNLGTAGNTGAASIFIMLDEYLKNHQLNDGDRLMLFIPESGQFNFVMVSLTAVVR